MDKRVTAVILAAGQGKRMNTTVAKQFLMLEGKPVLYYSIKAFEESLVDDIILVCGKGQVEYCLDNIIAPYGFKKVINVIEGGEERYDSVNRALLSIENTDYILIHDGARPFVSAELINEVIDEVRKYKACIVAAPVKDTIKKVDINGLIKETPDRNYMWLAQTPQAFEYSLLKRAYSLLFKERVAERKAITDDAMVYERYIHQPVKVVRGNYYNIKITTPEDMIIAKGILDALDK
jgi:2-C-methyl-D-erythritol 4-phosphate cytidylyltransferase